MKRVIRTKPEPWCPLCGAKMVLRRPELEQSLEPFWGCSRHPDCHGYLQIGPDGRPKRDEDWLDEGM